MREYKLAKVCLCRENKERSSRLTSSGCHGNLSFTVFQFVPGPFRSFHPSPSPSSSTPHPVLSAGVLMCAPLSNPPALPGMTNCYLAPVTPLSFIFAPLCRLADCTARQRAVTIICTDRTPLPILLLQMAIDYHAVALSTVTLAHVCVCVCVSREIFFFFLVIVLAEVEQFRLQLQIHLLLLHFVDLQS